MEMRRARAFRGDLNAVLPPSRHVDPGTGTSPGERRSRGLRV